MFNEGNYWERAKRGELEQRMRKDSHPSPPKAPEPLCTRSQIIAYFDSQGHQVAVVHQYVRPDGLLGAGGRPDPKRILENGILYGVVEPEENNKP
jgi:hypothetical protein